MAFNGPNKTLKEICLRSIAARPRLAFQISAKKTKKKDKQQHQNKKNNNNSNDDAGGEDMSSLPWRRAMAVYEATHERVRKMRAGRHSAEEDAEPRKKRSRRQRAQTPTRENVVTEEADVDRSILPNFLELVELKALLEVRMKKIGLIHDDSLPDNWFRVGPRESYTLNLSKVQFTPGKIVHVLEGVCAGGPRSEGSGAIHFNLSHCFNFTRLCVDRLLQLAGSKLVTLNLQGCSKLTDRDIRALVAGTPLLEHLDITACANYSEDLVTDVVLAHPNVAKFKSLHISGLPGVDTEVVDKICGGLCPALTAFSIGYCDTLPAACIERVVAAYPQMQHFGIHWIASVDDAIVQKIAGGMPQIRRLNVDGCKTVSSTAIEQLLAQRASSTEGDAGGGAAPAPGLGKGFVESGGCLSSLGCAFLAIPKLKLDYLRKVYPAVKITV